MSAAIIRGILSTAMQLSDWRVAILHMWVSLHSEEFSSHYEFDAFLGLYSCRLKSGVHLFLEQVRDPYSALSHPGAVFLHFLEFHR